MPQGRPSTMPKVSIFRRCGSYTTNAPPSQVIITFEICHAAFWQTVEMWFGPFSAPSSGSRMKGRDRGQSVGSQMRSQTVFQFAASPLQSSLSWTIFASSVTAQTPTSARCFSSTCASAHVGTPAGLGPIIELHPAASAAANIIIIVLLFMFPFAWVNQWSSAVGTGCRQAAAKRRPLTTYRASPTGTSSPGTKRRSPRMDGA